MNAYTQYIKIHLEKNPKDSLHSVYTLSNISAEKVRHGIRVSRFFVLNNITILLNNATYPSMSAIFSRKSFLKTMKARHRFLHQDLTYRSILPVPNLHNFITPEIVVHDFSIQNISFSHQELVFGRAFHSDMAYRNFLTSTLSI